MFVCLKKSTKIVLKDFHIIKIYQFTLEVILVIYVIDERNYSVSAESILQLQQSIYFFS